MMTIDIVSSAVTSSIETEKYWPLIWREAEVTSEGNVSVVPILFYNLTEAYSVTMTEEVALDQSLLVLIWRWWWLSILGIRYSGMAIWQLTWWCVFGDSIIQCVIYMCVSWPLMSIVCEALLTCALWWLATFYSSMYSISSDTFTVSEVRRASLMIPNTWPVTEVTDVILEMTIPWPGGYCWLS